MLNQTRANTSTVISYNQTQNLPTLLARIVLVGLTLSLPDMTVEVIEVVGGNIRDAAELEEVPFDRRHQHRAENERDEHQDRDDWGLTKRINCSLQALFIPSIQPPRPGRFELLWA